MLGMMSTKTIATLAAAGLLVAGMAVQTHRLSSEQRAHAETREQHAIELAQREHDAREAVQAAREEEQRRTAAVQEIANEAQQNLDRARDDAAAASDAGERLRRRVAELTTAAAVRGAACKAGAAGAGAPATATVDLLANVQRRLDDAQDRIAEFADRAHAAGTACERSYDTLR